MKRRLKKTFAIALILFLTGCANFITPPRVAHVQVKGPGNMTKQFAFSLDPTIQQNTDIHLSDRYAVELFFQWLWYEKEDLDATYTGKSQDGAEDQDLTPWFLCKYRF